MLEEKDLSPIAQELEGVVAMDAVFDQTWVSRLEGTRVKSETNKWDQAMALMADIENFKVENGCDRLVMVWCGSTEAFQEPSAVHETVAAFEQGLKDNDDNISPSQIYVYAAFRAMCRSPTARRTSRPTCPACRSSRTPAGSRSLARISRRARPS